MVYIATYVPTRECGPIVELARLEIEAPTADDARNELGSLRNDVARVLSIVPKDD
jgi:hypothetical protein